MIEFIAGVVLGGLLGVAVMCLLAVAREDQEY